MRETIGRETETRNAEWRVRRIPAIGESQDGPIDRLICNQCLIRLRGRVAVLNRIFGQTMGCQSCSPAR